jgi:hypothetical protein
VQARAASIVKHTHRAASIVSIALGRLDMRTSFDMVSPARSAVKISDFRFSGELGMTSELFKFVFVFQVRKFIKK